MSTDVVHNSHNCIIVTDAAKASNSLIEPLLITSAVWHWRPNFYMTQHAHTSQVTTYIDSPSHQRLPYELSNQYSNLDVFVYSFNKIAVNVISDHLVQKFKIQAIATGQSPRAAIVHMHANLSSCKLELKQSARGRLPLNMFHRNAKVLSMHAGKKRQNFMLQPLL